MHDDKTQMSPTMSDNDRPRPTLSDHDGQRPTVSATRSDHHTMTTTEVVQLFEQSALPREKRSIERYCEVGKLDCFKDPDEQRYYVTRESAEMLIGHLKELKSRHSQPSAAAPTASSGATVEDDVRPRPTVSPGPEDVKRGTPDKQSEKHPTGEYDEQLAKEHAEMKARLKELENENLLLKVGKLAAEKFATELGDYIKEDREHYTKLIQQTNADVAKYSRRLGQLETHIKHRQLPAPDRDTTADDDELDDATTIEAEFSEGPPPATDHQSYQH